MDVAELMVLAESAPKGLLQVAHGEIWDTREDGEPGIPLFRPAPKGNRLWGRWIDEGEQEALAALIVAAVNALPQLLATIAWQPIETAPRDGTEVLVAGGQYVVDSSMGGPFTMTGVALAEHRSSGFIPDAFPWRGANCGGHDEFYWYAPTHWMPLPAPPEQHPHTQPRAKIVAPRGRGM